MPQNPRDKGRPQNPREQKIQQSQAANQPVSRNYLPKDTRELSFTKIENFALMLHKIGAYRNPAENKTANSTHLRNCAGFRFSGRAFEPAEEQLAAIDDLCQHGFVASHREAKLLWRFVPGLGIESVFETGLSLHHVYGVPYLPGSGFKGAVRSFTIERYFGNSEEDALKDAGFTAIFGSGGDEEAAAGRVWFFDVLPVQQLSLKLDVMTPHYAPWYQERKPPGDYYDPIPVSFITVEKDTKFCFSIAVAKRHGDSAINSGKWHRQKVFEAATALLEEAIQQSGFGAKTSVGYGWFSTQ